ncbi:MAG: 4-phosphopantetheinyl transferase [Alphaproteobacteria bacterium]|jgi:holo-[acyl-carrier protein] synthase|nr:4-phosphopantetheinyl transferase [Alphaproteobacteria bacterium]
MILGIGNDLVDCRRIENTLKRFGSRFVNRVFTSQEQARIAQRSHQAAGYAKLFAMKEAVLKALGTGLAKGIIWHDIEIFREFKEAPRVELSGVAREVLKNQTPAGYAPHLHVSVSDEWPYAQAFAIISVISI